MNRVEIKNEAKEKIKDWDVRWNIIWPLLVISAITFFVGSINIFGGSITININGGLARFSSAESGVVAIIGSFLSAGYIKYLLNFVRTGKFDTNTIVNTIKKKWVDIFIAVVLVNIIVFIFALFLVVPGIIMGLAYTFAIYLVIDKNVAGSDSLKKSREMMNGYKWDYFVFCLSFIGWIILIPFTLGIICIWLVPYINVASVLYYDKLQKKLDKADE